MKKVLGTIAVIAALTLLVILIMVGLYNDMVGKRNATTKAWSDVEAAYQRRLDVIPKFAETAKFSIKFQKDLAIKYAEAREKVAEAAKNNKPDDLETVANAMATNLLISVRQEAVPAAKTDQLTELNAQVENIERVINHERKAFNQAVLDYNNAIQTVPGVWLASGWKFKPMTGFNAQEGAEKSPDLKLE